MQVATGLFSWSQAFNGPIFQVERNKHLLGVTEWRNFFLKIFISFVFLYISFIKHLRF